MQHLFWLFCCKGVTSPMQTFKHNLELAGLFTLITHSISPT